MAKMHTVGVRLDEDLLAAVIAISEREGRSMSGLIAYLVRESEVVRSWLHSVPPARERDSTLT